MHPGQGGRGKAGITNKSLGCVCLHQVPTQKSYVLLKTFAGAIFNGLKE